MRTMAPLFQQETETLASHLQRHARERPEARAMTFLKDGDVEDVVLTYGNLFQQACGVADVLRDKDLIGKPVVLLHPPGPEFVVAFCGCLLAGCIAVPLHAPTTTRLLERARAVIGDCGAAAMLTISSEVPRLDLLERSRLAPLILTDRLEPGAGPHEPCSPDPSAPAIIQYTSGSTGSPKGVVLSHRNLLVGSELIRRAFGTTPTDIGVSWLPLLHDMGLIGSVVHVLHQGFHCVHISPLAMIRRPACWLQAVHRYRATISGGPDFAWRLVCERVAPADLAGLNLSCWRVAYTGAEPIRQSTVERLSSLLSTGGFDPHAILTCYGLAEATLIVSGGPPGAELQIEAPASAPDGPGYVGCGSPVIDDSVAIVEMDQGRRCEEGVVGEIWVSGDHVATGYWDQRGATTLSFAAKLNGDSRKWLRTGDLGFLLRGQLFVTGRIKDVLIVHGRKHHAEDVEQTIQTQIDALCTGACVAFQLTDSKADIVVAIESRQTPHAADVEVLKRSINACVWRHHQLVIGEVTVVQRGRLPKTTSGKVQRCETRRLFLSGELGKRSE